MYMNHAAACLTSSSHVPWDLLKTSFGAPGREWMIDFEDGDTKTWARRVAWSPDAPSPLARLPAEEARHAAGLQVGPAYVEDYHMIETARKCKQRLETPHVAHAEFRIDVDMTDFEALRAACGCGADKRRMCATCWMALGHVGRYLVTALRDAFGLTRIATVFSGGRGLHVWAGDARACAWSAEMRRSVVQTLMTPPLSAFPPSCQAARAAIPSDALPLDRAVSEDRAHLLRTPFTPHHSSGLLATPVSLFDEGWHAWCNVYAEGGDSSSSTKDVLIPSVARLLLGDFDHRRALARAIDVWRAAWIRCPTNSST